MGSTWEKCLRAGNYGTYKGQHTLFNIIFSQHVERNMLNTKHNTLLFNHIIAMQHYIKYFLKMDEKELVVAACAVIIGVI